MYCNFLMHKDIVPSPRSKEPPWMNLEILVQRMDTSNGLTTDIHRIEYAKQIYCIEAHTLSQRYFQSGPFISDIDSPYQFYLCHCDDHSLPIQFTIIQATHC